MASQLSLPDLTTPFHLPTAASTSHPMPRLALGTFKVTGPTCRDAIVAALDAGIRHLDTAAIYKNHVEVAAALRLAGLPRDDVFLTTKISTYDMGSDLTPRAIQNALAELQTNYVDLLLLHWPGVASKKHTDPVHRARRREAWVALEAAVREGQARAIGGEQLHVRAFGRGVRIRDRAGGRQPIRVPPALAPTGTDRHVPATGRGAAGLLAARDGGATAPPTGPGSRRPREKERRREPRRGP